ncbi:hypothetical protein DGMP_33340 [Desulfomarina profundi]|uniref:Uncharacterized protein n=1 Tax=Desulfomarina profundi TaxID=2772557 RepID=A0A8D5FL78_9BACT|nr:hypothetical protein [Desulfomarina profundi]BCL62641.1 hypothetical protein DGMP_33340 [Desulfomarina profundi]
MPEKETMYYQFVIKINGYGEEKWAMFFALFDDKSAKNALLKNYMKSGIRIGNNIP